MKRSTKPFTRSQIYEIKDSIDLRIDTITDDPESATEFETVDNLNALKAKITQKQYILTLEERVWIWEEMEWKLEMAMAACENPEIGFKGQGDVNSLNNAINKVK